MSESEDDKKKGQTAMKTTQHMHDVFDIFHYFDE